VRSWVAGFVGTCERQSLDTRTANASLPLSEQQIAALMTKKVFFGHQSVGNNIIDGIQDLERSDARLKLNIVKSSEPQGVPGPAFVEYEVGRNTEPQSKVDAFASVINKGLGEQGGVALLKFCCVDIDASTDVDKMFAEYRDAVAALKSKYPALRIVHVTVPLTTVEPRIKAWAKGLLGKNTQRAVNVKRNRYNSLLERTYNGSEPIFDLAEVESTHSNGTRSYFREDTEIIYTLSPEYTVDGGHLNEAGRRRAAQQLLITLSQL